VESLIKEITNSNDNRRNFVGATANVVLYAKGFLYVANLGDSKCLLQREDEVIELSQDHLPYNVQEWERIEKAGGFVDEKGRLNGTLAMSRAFGDFEFKSEGNRPKDE
jgi:serine/threonine protein phosphatase PrpC